MYAKWVLHLVLLRCFQLPLELRIIIVESYFPFWHERFTLQTPELLEFATATSSWIKYCHFIAKEKSNEPREWVYALCLKRKGTLLSLFVYKGVYETLPNGCQYVSKKVLYCNENIVSANFDTEEITTATINDKLEQITTFYRKWVVDAINGIGCFKSISST